METYQPHDIKKVESTNEGVIITLRNDVVIHLSSNEGYLHLHFSHTAVPMQVKVSHYQSTDTMQVPNYFDVSYQRTDYI